MHDRSVSDVRQAKNLVSGFQKHRRAQGMWERTTAEGWALEMPPQNSSQATETLGKYDVDGDCVVKSPVWPAHRKGLDSSSNVCSVVDLS